jgi:hypothetical protein
MSNLDKQLKPYSTSIEDLSAVGNELSEEHLSLVVGGMRKLSFVGLTYVGGERYNDYNEDN